MTTVTTTTLPNGRTLLRCSRCGSERLVERVEDVAEDEAFFIYEHKACEAVSR